MVSNRIRDDSKEFFVGVGRPNGESVEELNHETGESLEGSGNPDRGRYFNQDALGCVYVDLQPPGLINRGVKQGQQALEARNSQHVECRLAIGPELRGSGRT